MSNRLSHSSVTKFKYCPTAYKLHYIDRYRSTSIPSALIFGGAVGKAFEYLINPFAFKDSDPLLLTAEEIFNKYWNHQEVNGVLTDLKTSPNVIYFKSDFDPELGVDSWHSMQTKAHLMIKAFRENLLPKISIVHSTEEKVEISSGDDVSIGYCDAVLDIVGYDTPIILDFKTAGRPYEKNSVKESEQLSQYLYTLGDKYNTRLAGYAVFLKQINKNRKKICKECDFDGSATRHKTCNHELQDANGKYLRCNGEFIESIHPTCTMQLIIDEIPLEFENSVIEGIGLVNDSINSGLFTQNFDACDNDYGKKCTYYNLCHNSSTDGLIVLSPNENTGRST